MLKMTLSQTIKRIFGEEQPTQQPQEQTHKQLTKNPYLKLATAKEYAIIEAAIRGGRELLE